MTDAEIIVALGDTAVVADRFGVSRTAVSNWKRRGIPWRFRSRVAAAAKRRFALPDGFYGERK